MVVLVMSHRIVSAVIAKMVFVALAAIAVRSPGIVRGAIRQWLLVMMRRAARGLGEMRVVALANVRLAPLTMTVLVPRRLRSILAVSTIRSFVMAIRLRAHRVALIHASPMANVMQTRIAIIPA